MKFIQTLKNIFKIEDLRARIFYTLAIVALYRLGKYITLPGIDPSMLQALQTQTSKVYGACSISSRVEPSPRLPSSHRVYAIHLRINRHSAVGIVFPYFQSFRRRVRAADAR